MVYLIIGIVLIAGYAFWQYSYKWAKRAENSNEIEDNPTGNSNISKKFIDHM